MLTTTQPKRPVELDDVLESAPAPANDIDRRGAAPALRVVPRWSLAATLTADSEDALYAGLSYEVAHGGVFVATVDTPPVGARVDVALTLADGRTIDAAGVVRWVRDAALASDGLPAGCGVECKGLPIHVVRALEALAAAREPILWLAEVA